MITLITGTPGAGKTLLTVAEELPKYKGRPLFVDGIPDLTIDHSLPLGDVDKWHEWIPDGAVLVVDEAQRVWRPRGTGSAVPAGVSAMETHRHKGADIILVTQHPNLLDANVRRLVGRHIHVRRMFGWKRAVVYEWDAATDPARVATAIKRTWKYPSKAFNSYKSATVHTARSNRVPLVFIAAAVGVVLVPLVWYKALDGTAFNKKKPESSASVSQSSGQISHGKVYPVASVVPANLAESVTPVDPQNPLSAPLYSPVAPAVVPPVITGCIASSKACSCYSQQSTPVWVPESQCRQRAAGTYYDPYHRSEQVQVVNASAPDKKPSRDPVDVPALQHAVISSNS